MYMCLGGIDFASVYTIFQYDFGIVPKFKKSHLNLLTLWCKIEMENVSMADAFEFSRLGAR
jgi:hypothetical protein